VRVVVADTGPINYLVLIGQDTILPALFEKVLIPSAVRDELARAQTPEAARSWIQDPPTWLDVRSPHEDDLDDGLENLDDGERAALILVASMEADLLLMDDRESTRVARGKGLRVIGRLRVLQLAARRGLVDLAESLERIKRTNFRYRQELMDELLDE
jgi:predicted nucleic acid-binding protein